MKIHPIKTDENLPNFSKVAIILVTEGVMIFLKKGRSKYVYTGVGVHIAVRRSCAYFKEIHMELHV